METGLLGVTFNKSNGDENTYAYAIGFLVGLFSDDVMKKLAEVAKTVFGKNNPDNAKPATQTARYGQDVSVAGPPAGIESAGKCTAGKSYTVSVGRSCTENVAGARSAGRRS